MESLVAPFGVIARAVVDWWREWITLAVINVIWVLCWLTVVLGPPATFAVYAVAHDLARGQTVGVGDLLGAGRRYFVKSWLWLLTNVVVALVLLANLTFYAQQQASWTVLAQALSLMVGIFWLIIQLYALPYFFEQEEKRLGLAYRNGLLTILASPGYTLVIVTFAGLIAVLSVVLTALLFLGGPCLIAVLANHAVLERLEHYRVRERV